MKTLEWLGAITGMLGAGLLALNLDVSKLGWILFLLSNYFWIAFAILNKLWGLLWMQLVFTATSITGIIRWFT